jgi:monolysocardiolipin acyltransferase
LRFVAGEVKVSNRDLFIKTAFKRSENRPLITLSNHDSTLDDPLIWMAAIKFPELMRNMHNMRWTMGAKEICFRNTFNSWVFGNGRVFPIERGLGIHQEGMRCALDLLNQGQWVHIFPEGKVNQSGELLRFKWGVGKLLCESEVTPLILPVYHHGMSGIMPEGVRPRYPHPRKPLTVMVGPRVIDWQAAIRAAKQRGVTGPRLWTLITARLAVLMALIRLRVRHTINEAMDEQLQVEPAMLKSLEELEIDDTSQAELNREMARGDSSNGLKINVHVERGEVSIAQERANQLEELSGASNDQEEAEVSIDALIAALITDPNLNELDVTAEVGPSHTLSFYVPPSNLIAHVYNRIIRIRGNRNVMLIAETK